MARTDIAYCHHTGITFEIQLKFLLSGKKEDGFFLTLESQFDKNVQKLKKNTKKESGNSALLGNMDRAFYREIAVPVRPAMPSRAFSSRVIKAVRPGLDSAKRTAASTFGSMEPGAN